VVSAMDEGSRRSCSRVWRVENVGGGGMVVTTALGNSGRPVPSSKWRVRQTTADSHPNAHPHR